jgi:hypothetical protein
MTETEHLNAPAKKVFTGTKTLYQATAKNCKAVKTGAAVFHGAAVLT